jgi:hypothetical protein
MEDRLWDYLDGHCSPAEKSAVEELISTNREWQIKHRELLDIQQLLNSSDLEAPSMRFAKNVMEEIARFNVAPATRTYVNKNIIRGIGAFFLTMIAGILIFMFTQLKWRTGSGSGDNFNVPLDKLGNRLDNLNYAKLFNSTYITIFLSIAVIAGFMLLDMYLQQKKQSRSF